MNKELRDFIAVAGARARWCKADVREVREWTPAMREYMRKRDDYERKHGVFLHFLEEP